VFFRRTTPQVTNPGGLWDESLNFYPRLGGTPRLRAHEWHWPRGGKIKFSHLQFDTTVYDWQGAQITLICFDELTHFTAHQFFYMVSRNRSTCGVRPYIRATCNPMRTAGSPSSWRGGSTRRPGFRSPSAPAFCAINPPL
jgi:Terminase large subunit, T4likevirus-type, N-terminal